MSTYGTGTDQIDPFFEYKREWSKTKDEIVGKYFDCYLKTIPNRGQRIIIVDGFSGPGRFGDGSDGSPLIICKAVTEAHRGVSVKCLFADAKPKHRAELSTCLQQYIESGIAEPPFVDFPTVLARAFEIGNNATLFFYLDPYGIKELDLDTVRQIYERDKQQSTEVLLNFSIPTFLRMSGNRSESDTPTTATQKVKHGKRETINRVMGGDHWQAIIAEQQMDSIQREDKIVALYVERLRQFFQYAYTIPVKKRPETGVSLPADQLAKYHLIFGTRSPRAVRYINDVAFKALQSYFATFTEGVLLDLTPMRYEQTPIHDIKAAILNLVESRPLTRPDIYEAIIPRYFAQRSTTGYRGIIQEMTFADRSLFPDPATVKQLGKLNDATRLSRTPWKPR